MYSAVFLGSVVALTWWKQFPTIRQPIVEYYGFRQTQTAWQAETLSTGEGTLLHPKLPVFGHPWEVPFEMPIFQLSASWMMQMFDLPSDAASRLASLIWFSLCLIPLWLVGRKFLGRRDSALCVLLFSFSPLAIIVNRAALIEYCAVFFSLLFVYFMIRAIDAPRRLDLLFAAVAGAFAAAVKSTTFIGAVIFIVMLHFLPTVKRIRSRRDWSIRLWGPALPVGFALAAMLLWTRHADAIKAASDATRWLTSRNLTEWNLGTIQQRLEMSNYRAIQQHLDDGFGTVSMGVLALFLAALDGEIERRRFGAVIIGVLTLSVPLFLWSDKRIRLTITSIGTAALTIFLFFNLYVEHGYYFVAVSPYIALGVTGLVSVLITALLPRFRVAQSLSVAIIAVLLLVPSLQMNAEQLRFMRGGSHHYYTNLQAYVPPDVYVLVADSGWDPEYLYGNKRRGVMLNNPGMNMEFLRSLPDLDKYGYVVGPAYNLELFSLKRYTSPITTELFAINDVLDGLPRNSFALDSQASNVGASAQDIRITCNQNDVIYPSDVPRNAHLEIAKNPKQQIVFTNSGSALPTGIVLIPTQLDDDSTPVGITCAGGGSLVMRVRLNHP